MPSLINGPGLGGKPLFLPCSIGFLRFGSASRPAKSMMREALTRSGGRIRSCSTIPSSARGYGPSTGRSSASFSPAMPQPRSVQHAIIPIAPAPKPRAGSANHSCHLEETAMPLTAQQLRQFAEEGYLFLPGCFSEEEVAILRDEAEQIYATDRPGGLAREDRRAAHRLCRAHLQRGVPPAGQPSAADRPGRAGVRRTALHAPVQDQREGGVRGRCLAMAPGLRHLGARRRHAASRGR